MRWPLGLGCQAFEQTFDGLLCCLGRRKRVADRACDGAGVDMASDGAIGDALP